MSLLARLYYPPIFFLFDDLRGALSLGFDTSLDLGLDPFLGFDGLLFSETLLLRTKFKMETGTTFLTGKPPISLRSIMCFKRLSMAHRFLKSPMATKEMASPEAPARPVRPMR